MKRESSGGAPAPTAPAVGPGTPGWPVAALVFESALSADGAPLLPSRPADYYADYDTPPPLAHPERPIPPPPPEGAGPEEQRQWAERCFILRTMFGSGH
jgi:hypothetical protein